MRATMSMAEAEQIERDLDAAEHQAKKLNGDDAPRVGELSSKAFTDMTRNMLEALAETVEAQYNDIDIKRNTILAQLQELHHEMDGAFTEYQKQVEKHRDRMREISAKINSRVEQSSTEMIDLSKRLQAFSQTVDEAHASFFK